MQKIFGDTAVCPQLRMKCHCQLLALPDGGYSAVVFCKNLDPGRAEFDLRCTDETHRNIFYIVKSSVDMKTAQLSAVSVAADIYFQRAEVYGGVVKDLLRQ